MSFGINLYNQSGNAITYGDTRSLMYWGKVTYNVQGNRQTSVSDTVYAERYPVFNLPESVPYVCCIALNTFPFSSSSQWYPYLLHGNGSPSSPFTYLTLGMYGYSSQYCSITVYLFVPSTYIADLESQGIRVYNDVGEKVWSTDRPMFKVAGFMKQQGTSCTLAHGGVPDRPAMTIGGGSSDGYTVMGGCYYGSTLKFSKETIGVPIFRTGTAIYKPMIDRDYYDQFSNLGNF